MSSIITVVVILFFFLLGYFIIGKIYDALFTKRKKVKVLNLSESDILSPDESLKPSDTKEKLLYHSLRLIGKASPKSDFYSNIRRTLLEDFIRREFKIELTNYDETIKIIRQAQISDNAINEFVKPVLDLSGDKKEFLKNLYKFLINHHNIDGELNTESKTALTELSKNFEN